MKRTLSMIALAVLTVGLLGSCSKINERLDNLEKKVDGIENEQIATINGQIDGIKTSIADLKQIRDDISNLKQTAEAHGEDISALQEADETLGNRIDNLEDYLENVLPDYAEKEWVEATFSTLEQYDSTCTAIAEINAKIGELDTKIAKDIETCVDSMKTWVNENLDAYYTAAQMDAELAKMKSAVDSAKAAGKISDTKADSVATELTKTKTAVDTAKSNIRSEYKAAIKTAIDSSEGRLTKALNDAIATVNGKITNLSVRVDALYDEVNILAGEVTALENMIQSVTIVPAYSDGSVKVDDKDSLYIDCIIAPTSAVESLDSSNFVILVKGVARTKAGAGIDSVKIASSKDLEIDTAKGVASIKVMISDKLPVNDSTVTVAVNVRNGISNFTTDFVPVTIPVSVSLDKHSISLEYATDSRDIELVAKVRGTDKGVEWKTTGHYTSVDEPGKVTVNANAIGKDTIVVKTNEGNVTDTCFITIIPDGFVDLGVVVDGKPLYWAKCNLGADNPEDNGDYFAWGETEPYYTTIGGWPDELAWKDGKNEGYAYNSYLWNLQRDDVTTYILKSDYDAATKKNPSWRTPTKDDFLALAANCVWIWTGNYNSKNKAGYIVYKAKNEDDKGKANINDSWKKWDVSESEYKMEGASEATGYTTSDTHIFLPAAGYAFKTNVITTGENGYWSSTLNVNNTTMAKRLEFLAQYINTTTSANRYCGFPIRPVAD